MDTWHDLVGSGRLLFYVLAGPDAPVAEKLVGGLLVFGGLVLAAVGLGAKE